MTEMVGCETLAGAALFACLARNPACLPPSVDRELVPWLEAIGRHESGFRPWAIRDDVTKESIFPATRAEAERIAAERLARGHVLGLGWMQITHRANWVRFGLADAQGRPVRAFDPCLNLRAGALHFAADHERRTKLAATADYNGSGPAARAYALRVEATARKFVPDNAPPPLEPERVSKARRVSGRQFVYATSSTER
jgi:hypothetical protein